jgi:hypothetical protein
MWAAFRYWLVADALLRGPEHTRFLASGPGGGLGLLLRWLGTAAWLFVAVLCAANAAVWALLGVWPLALSFVAVLAVLWGVRLAWRAFWRTLWRRPARREQASAVDRPEACRTPPPPPPYPGAPPWAAYGPPPGATRGPIEAPSWPASPPPPPRATIRELPAGPRAGAGS